eukprot:scaffold233583_cov28-Tisochrysis_lutea.AAC.4
MGGAGSARLWAGGVVTARTLRRAMNGALDRMQSEAAAGASRHPERRADRRRLRFQQRGQQSLPGRAAPRPRRRGACTAAAACGGAPGPGRLCRQQSGVRRRPLPPPPRHAACRPLYRPRRCHRGQKAGRSGPSRVCRAARSRSTPG